jgi:hypothetical protein
VSPRFDQWATKDSHLQPPDCEWTRWDTRCQRSSGHGSTAQRRARQGRLVESHRMQLHASGRGMSRSTARRGAPLGTGQSNFRQVWGRLLDHFTPWGVDVVGTLCHTRLRRQGPASSPRPHEIVCMWNASCATLSDLRDHGVDTRFALECDPPVLGSNAAIANKHETQMTIAGQRVVQPRMVAAARPRWRRAPQPKHEVT